MQTAPQSEPRPRTPAPGAPAGAAAPPCPPLVPAVDLDLTFKALADPTRRRVLERLGLGAASVSELAAPFDMALPTFLEHMHTLERGGLVDSTKAGRVRTYCITPQPLHLAGEWLASQRQLWQRRLDQLDALLADLAAAEREERDP